MIMNPHGRPLRVSPLLLLVVVLVLVVLVVGGAALARAPLLEWMDRAVVNDLPGQRVRGNPLDELPRVAVNPLCEVCGIVDSMREIPAQGDQPARHEVTVRLRDGSMRVNENATPGQWRKGDRIMLLGGPSPSSSPLAADALPDTGGSR